MVKTSVQVKNVGIIYIIYHVMVTPSWMRMAIVYAAIASSMIPAIKHVQKLALKPIFFAMPPKAVYAA